MKRMIRCMTVFVSLFVFFYLYSSLGEMQYLRLSRFETTYAEQTGMEPVWLTMRMYDENANTGVPELLGFLEEYNYDAMIVDYETRYDFIQDTGYYLFTDRNLNDLDVFHTVHEKPINFRTAQTGYYSSSVDDTEALDTIDFIRAAYNREYQPHIRILPLQRIHRDHPERNVASIIFYTTDPVQLQSRIANSVLQERFIDDDRIIDQGFGESEEISLTPITILAAISAVRFFL